LLALACESSQFESITGLPSAQTVFFDVRTRKFANVKSGTDRPFGPQETFMKIFLAWAKGLTSGVNQKGESFKQ
jgi:hypothetical protein